MCAKPAPSAVAKEKAAVAVVKELRRRGFIALFAGGCVRDKIMRREPEDFDVATDARPDDVIAAFPATKKVGARFGVVLVIKHGIPIEVTTFRRDDEYLDGRRPTQVEFTDARGDASRRDFTVNGLFMDPVSGRILDYVNGRKDIKAKLIRAIGDPVARFAEDRLRMLRAIRFACALGFEIEPKTFDAIKRFAHDIKGVSLERVVEELKRMLTSEAPDRAVRMMQETGLNDVILPEVSAMVGVEQPSNFHPEGDVFEHTCFALSYLRSPSFELAMGVLLHDVGKVTTIQRADRIRFPSHESEGAQIAKSVCRRLKLSNASTERIAWLVRKHMTFKDVENMRLSTLKRLLGHEGFMELAELQRVDALASTGDLSHYNFCMAKLREFGEERTKPKPLIDGHDLIELGLEPGPIFGEILKQVQEEQLDEKLRTREQALARARQIARNISRRVK